MDNYYVSSNLPECFRAADEIMAKRSPKKKIIRRVKEVPVPDIDSNPNINGPLGVTEDFYLKEKAKKNKKIEKMKETADIDLIQLAAKKDMLIKKLNKLDIGKKKDAKKIATINIEIHNIDNKIKMIETQTGVKSKEIIKGTKWGRFFDKVKTKAKKIGKKIKKFITRNSEAIVGVIAVAIPSIISLISKLIGA